MGLFDSIRRLWDGPAARDRDRERLARAWGLDADQIDPGVLLDAPADEAGPMPEGPAPPVAYDRTQWHKKLKRVLDELPHSAYEYPDVAAEAQALGFDPDWVRAVGVEEFTMLVRRAVADQKFTELEHRKVALARELLGLPTAEAEALVDRVVAEAEQFFGGQVEGA